MAQNVDKDPPVSLGACPDKRARFPILEGAADQLTSSKIPDQVPIAFINEVDRAQSARQRARLQFQVQDTMAELGGAPPPGQPNPLRERLDLIVTVHSIVQKSQAAAARQSGVK